MAPPPKLLIVSASIGGGHVAAGRALEEAALGEGLFVQHVDLLSYTAPGFRRLYRQSYFELVKTAPDFIDWLGKRLDRHPREQQTRQERAFAQMTWLISRSLLGLVRQSAPDVVVHTHFLPPAILARMRRLSVPQVVVVTDYAAHNLWLHAGVGRYFVASEEVAAHLLAVGVEAARVRVTGIPIGGRFRSLESQAQARATLGLPPERDVLLLMASGLDRGTLRSLLAGLKALKWPLTGLVICGRSRELVRVAEREVGREGDLVNLQVLGFTDEMPRYMAAADLLVGKPGGLTTSEALAAGLPFAVVSPYPLQEEANATFLLERGAGLRLEPLTVLPFKLRRFFEDAPRRARMRASARSLARPEAAQAVLRSLLEEPLPVPKALRTARIWRLALKGRADNFQDDF